MTAPRADGADRIPGARRRDGAGAAIGSLAVLLLVGLLLRLTIAYVLLPGSGFESDIGTFSAWSIQLGNEGPGSFYATAGFADYPPGYLYVLWLLGGLGHVLAPFAHGDAGSAVVALIKLPSIFADIGVGALLYFVVRSWRAPRRDAARLGMVAAAMYLFNPVTWYDSAIWGQTDAFGALIILLSVAALVRGNSEGASVLAVLAALIKPQFGIVMLPIVGIVLLRRHLLRPGTNPRHPVLVPTGLRAWFETEQGVWRLVSSATAALVVLLALLAPFSMDVPRFINQMVGTAGGYPYLSVNAYNMWAFFGAGGSDPLAFGGGWSSDAVAFLGPLPAVIVGGLLLAIGFAIGVLRLVWRDDRRSIVVVTIFLSLAFFMLPTRVHERYMFPVFGLLPLLAVIDRRWLAATVVLSIGAFINFHGVLTQELYATPNLEHLPLGELFRQPLGVLAAIALNLGGFIFVAWEMRPRPAAVTEEPAAAVDEARIIRAVGAPVEDPWSAVPAGGLAYAVAGGDADGDGAFDSDAGPPREPSAASRWLSGIVDRAPVRRDRSALLIGESGGRLDRKDAALMLVVFLAALMLRTYRLEVPYGPHFDEVYHARTAVEFLQDWRYGINHDIYEYTHPHMAKYLMAVGIAALGNNRVTATSDLGVSVKDAALEERWEDPNQLTARKGDRLYVVTSQDLRVYDLATRAEVARLPGFYAAVAIDQTSHTVYIADAAGAVSQIPTGQLDEARASGGTAAVAAFPFAQFDSLNGALQLLTIVGSSLIGVSDTSAVVSADLTTGQVTGTASLTSVSSVISAGSRSMVFVDSSQVTDSAALATALASLLATDADPIQTAINAAAGGRVAVAGDVGGVADDVQAAIDDGTLTGVSVENGDVAAVGTATSVSLLNASSLVSLREFPMTSPVTGMALVSQGPEKPTIYAASGNELIKVQLPSDGPAAQLGSMLMPNIVESVLWNPATTNIHVLGLSQDGQAQTIYVVEPRSNSVFADARLAFAPQALVMDAMRLWPSEDRDDIIALSSVGQLATVDVGNNQWAYRFPGVLLGALMGVLIYLLVRFLFARRSIAIIASLLVLADGMFFANSRIAMNDIYVAFFIVAAVTLFVPLWLGRWRSRPALIGGFLAIGVLFGLAFASKWVGLYAMGGVGLLILLRSALGRYIALFAMVGMTAVLGYIAITPPALVENPQVNYLFLFVMVALTACLAVGIALRPMRMSTEETRLAVLVALAPGPLVLVYGLIKLFGGGPPPVLGTLLTPQRITLLGAALTVAGVALIAALWFLRRRGIGPFSRTPAVAASGEPASPPPPRGWLRPGSGFLGMSWMLALSAVLIIPFFIYTLSYIPWINLGNRWTPDFPAGNHGQTFLDLQKGMYDYHNNLRATHPASSPWWAWPFDLKPVWFEQADYGGSTTAVIYDTGNLVIFWLAIPAVAWLAWQAWRRRSLPLAFIAVAIASLWLPWARIDRATFQYHIFTTLPFSFMAVAYFLGELWHGPSARTWLLARVAAAVAIIGAPLLWLLRLPLCGIAQTEKVNAGSETCGALSRQLVLTDLQAVGLLLAVAGLAAAAVLVYLNVRPAPATASARSPVWPLLLPISFAVTLFGVVIVTVGAGLPGNPVLQTTVRAEEPAFVALLLLAVPAYFVLRAADPRKFVIGALSAAVIWFVAFYPNIASLPVPTPLSQIHLGLLPTWNWGFQFAVNLDPANTSPISWSGIGLLAVAVIGLCVAAVYAARSWYSARSPRDDVSALPETG